MPHQIRPFDVADAEAVVALSVRAWTPVFESMRDALGEVIFGRLYPGWMDDQATAVRDNLSENGITTWVATVDDAVAGFALVVLHDESPVGEIDMIAVDPAFQRRGIARALTDFATSWIAAAGKTVAVVGTGGDPGHRPARLTYESAGYRALPVHKYYKAL